MRMIIIIIMISSIIIFIIFIRNVFYATLWKYGGVYMITARLSFQYEFTPVPSCGYHIFVNI